MSHGAERQITQETACTSPVSEHQVFQFSSSIPSTPFAAKPARTHLFLRENKTRFMPSNSSKRTSGGGPRGTMRTTLDSTCGGGRKLPREPFITWSTCAYSCTFALSRDQNSLPGVAVSRSANSRWNMRIATRKSGRCESSLKTSGDEICTLVCELYLSRDRKCH